MQIWVDADACPKVIKDILFRAAERQRIALILVANKPLHTPPSRYIRALQVPAGFDVADNHIVEQVQAGDLVITADIPLAAAVIDARRARAESRAATLYDGEHPRAAEPARLHGSLRSTGVNTGGPPALGLATGRRSPTSSTSSCTARPGAGVVSEVSGM